MSPTREDNDALRKDHEAGERLASFRIARELEDYKRMYEEMLDMKNRQQDRAVAAERDLQARIDAYDALMKDALKTRADLNKTNEWLGRVRLELASARADGINALLDARRDAPSEVAHILDNQINLLRAKWYAGMNEAPDCGCIETYPQLIPGKVSHAPDCSGGE